jgi:hypothetical protein
VVEPDPTFSCNVALEAVFFIVIAIVPKLPGMSTEGLTR